MLGAIVGDVVGSRFEFANYRGKDFELFAPQSRATDDSIMTLAIAKAIIEAAGAGRGFDEAFFDRLGPETIRQMQAVGRNYHPAAAYGGSFQNWLFDKDPQPYNSFGNGAAMRVSAAGIVGNTEEEVKRLSRAVTEISHDHPEGIKGAEAVAMAIYLARNGASKDAIRERIEADYYPLDFTIDEIRPHYAFTEICQDTVPQAIQCFLEADSFEDAIRTAISLGGDSDTIGAITGSIAEAYYGVPDDIAEQALGYLDGRLGSLYKEWVDFMEHRKAS